MADSLFGNLASGLGSLFGASDSTQGILSGIGDIGNFALGAYDTYQGFQTQGMANDYLSALYGSQAKSDAIIQEQFDRAKELYWPVEELQAQYAKEDLEKMRPLQQEQQQYAIDKGYDDIAFAQGTVDPTEKDLISFLAEGADPQKYMNIASTNIGQSYDQAFNETQRSLAKMGVNPNSGAFQDMARQNLIGKAAAEAGARTDASRMAEDLDIARKGQALNLWSGIPLSTNTSPYSGESLATLASSGLQQSAGNLTQAAKLASSFSDDYFAGATALFGQSGGK
mgnify:CR=1 FL=1